MWEGNANVTGRIVVLGARDSRVNYFCSRFGRRKLERTTLGEEKRKMTSARRPLLWREITILLAVKVAALTCLYLLFFDPSHRPLADTSTVSAHVLSTDR